VLNSRRDDPQQGRPEENAAHDFPDRGRLAESGEQAPDAMRGEEQNRQRDQQPRQVNVSEFHIPTRSRPPKPASQFYINEANGTNVAHEAADYSEMACSPNKSNPIVKQG
jgi:hypothetical protein